MTTTERWDVFEIALSGPSEGNPFLDIMLSAEFVYGDRTIPVHGFYDGDGVYRVRFMPDTEGEWRFTTASNAGELDGQQGSFVCTPASPGNHGPVRVHNTHHFAYADGTPHGSVGTTCYAWTHQGDSLEEQTLATLAAAPFNKMRMCVFPKHYIFNQNEPPLYPFEGTPLTDWDYSRFNPAYFRHFEKRIAGLRDLGIEADIILFHPYDRWGFQSMEAETDDRYLRYVVARMAAYRNVWWSLANEFDFMNAKTDADWDRFFQIIADHDPYGHLRSIHNGTRFYDHRKPLVTHASVQTGAMESGRAWRKEYGKPVVFDEVCYEGNIEDPWGNITAQELVHRFWRGTIAGCYVGHGETYLHPDEVLWWSKGGVLHGESAPRIEFLRRILEAAPPGGLDPFEGNWRYQDRCAMRPGEFYLFYFGPHQPSFWTLPEGGPWRVEVIDTWQMTISAVGETWSGNERVPLPAKPYQALRVVRPE